MVSWSMQKFWWGLVNMVGDVVVFEQGFRGFTIVQSSAVEAAWSTYFTELWWGRLREGRGFV